MRRQEQRGKALQSSTGKSESQPPEWLLAAALGGRRSLRRHWVARRVLGSKGGASSPVFIALPGCFG